jgi:hypothetical protein
LSVNRLSIVPLPVHQVFIHRLSERS